MGFNELQANVAGINKKKTELQKMFHEYNIHVAMLQETQHKSCNYNISGYVPHTCSCNSCRGIITFIRKDLQCDVTQHTADTPNDILLSTVWFGDKNSNFIMFTVLQRIHLHSPLQPQHLKQQYLQGISMAIHPFGAIRTKTQQEQT